MANEERTEQATPQRRKDARAKGQVAKSMEVNAALGLLAAVLGIKWFGGALVTTWQDLTVRHLAMLGHLGEFSPAAVQDLYLTACVGFLRLVMPLLLFLLVVGVASNLGQTGLIFSAQALKFDFARLNPLQGIARMFSQRAVMDLVKALAKGGILGYVIYRFFHDRGEELCHLVVTPNERLGMEINALALDLMLKAAAVILVIAGIDYLFQRYQFEKSLRMTKQEIKEEYKRMEGDPHVKGRIRSLQRAMAQRRMMSDVPKATVVITNPTHLAIALRYAPGEMGAPRVLAIGQRLVAQKIKAIAQEHHIPVVENKPLAWALFGSCKVGDEIPVELYEAVAEIIAFVFRQSGRTAAALR